MPKFSPHQTHWPWILASMYLLACTFPRGEFLEPCKHWPVVNSSVSHPTPQAVLLAPRWAGLCDFDTKAATRPRPPQSRRAMSPFHIRRRWLLGRRGAWRRIPRFWISSRWNAICHQFLFGLRSRKRPTSCGFDGSLLKISFCSLSIWTDSDQSCSRTGLSGEITVPLPIDRCLCSTSGGLCPIPGLQAREGATN